MNKTPKLEDLTVLFRKLGAPHPEGWASSQIHEGIPQLERYLFLRQAWRCVVAEDDSYWIDAYVRSSESEPDAPYAGVGRALAAMRAKGVSDDQVTDLVRGMQAELLFQICYQLEDPGDLEDDVKDLSWALFSVDEEGKPIEPIGGLHESVLETDPTGREMRPR